MRHGLLDFDLKSGGSAGGGTSGGGAAVVIPTVANGVAGLGDSITAAALNYFYRNYSSSIVAGSYIYYALTLPKTGDTVSEGKLVPLGIYGASGMTTIQIKNTYLQQVLAARPRPGFCFVLGGTNDVATFGTPANVTTWISNLTSIYTQLLAANIVPLACGIPTIGVAGSQATNRSYIPGANSQLQTVAAGLGIPYIDFFALTDNGSDGWITGYCGNSGAGDNHPSVLGATVMGQAVRDLLDTYAVGFSAPNLVTATTDATADLIFSNGAMLDDSNADGIPDGGQTQSATQWSPSGNADMAFSLVAEPGVVSGNWLKMARTGNTQTLRFLGNGSAAQLPTVAPGDKIEIGWICKVVNPQDTAVINFSAYDKTNTTNVVCQWILTKLAGNVAPFKTRLTYIVPASGVTQIRMEFGWSGGTGEFYIGQFTIRKI